MTSEQSNEKTEKQLLTQLGSLNIDVKLADLRGSPLTVWDNLKTEDPITDGDLLLERRAEQFQDVLEKQDCFPELVLVWHLTQAFENMMQGELSNAMKCINEAELSLADIIQKATMKNVEKVLQYLFIGTKCRVLKELGQLEEVDELLQGICNINDMNDTELAMLLGCLCSAMLIYYNNHTEGLTYAERAIRHDPSNGKWHYLQAQNCRNIRRREWTVYEVPTQRETLAYQEAYRLFPNVLFGVSLAQMYRESRNNDMALKIYKEVHAFQPASCDVRLKLALGFIRTDESDLAKECLDFVAEKRPDCTWYTHYMGIYHEKCKKDLKTALAYYKSTTENFNWVAEWQYVTCRKKVEPDWDPLPYLLSWPEKYKNYAEHIILQMDIDIGLYYLIQKHDTLSACQYLTKAIEIDPNSKQLKSFSMLFHSGERINVYHVLAKEVRFALEIGTSMYDDEKISVLEKTLELCRKNCMNSSPPLFSRAQAPRPQSANNYRNSEQGSSPRTNWRERGSSSSVQDFPRHFPPRSGSDERNSPRRSSGSSHERDYTSWRSGKQ